MAEEADGDTVDYKTKYEQSQQRVEALEPTRAKQVLL